ncbi:hypothetical protein Mapa_016771 [Marchantia paleacea]|nr:hypothetical protein Mapa_016771 [Marchantia paleacea]
MTCHPSSGKVYLRPHRFVRDDQVGRDYQNSYSIFVNRNHGGGQRASYHTTLRTWRICKAF